MSIFFFFFLNIEKVENCNIIVNVASWLETDCDESGLNTFGVDFCSVIRLTQSKWSQVSLCGILSHVAVKVTGETALAPLWRHAEALTTNM